MVLKISYFYEHTSILDKAQKYYYNHFIAVDQ
jgi:hypothetical protein